MAKFQKGNKANPYGKGGHPLLKQIKALSIEDVGSAVALLTSKMNLEDLKDIKDNPGFSLITQWVASIAYEGITKGDPYPLELLLNRIHGRPKERIEADTEFFEQVKALKDLGEAKLLEMLKLNDTIETKAIEIKND